jgi:hypothetical protein
MHLRRGSSVDSRRNTQVVDFDVERHTLVIGGVTHVFHQRSTTVSQFPASRAHLFRVKAQASGELLIQLVPSRENPEIPFRPS